MERAVGDCIDTLRNRSADTKHVTDKMPHTFVTLGFLLTLLPEAKVVHVHRNPVITAFRFTKTSSSKNRTVIPMICGN
ncbi:MAG: sulfotransferase [Alphaproteobacteria bacterium]|nr:sulfotransferase [Alphaproteobacteria bacterium]